MVEKRVPDVLYYFTKWAWKRGAIRRFQAVQHEAKVAAKTPENAGFAGELLGRAVVSLVGTKGLDEDDPLMKLETMQKLLME